MMQQVGGTQWYHISREADTDAIYAHESVIVEVKQ